MTDYVTEMMKKAEVKKQLDVCMRCLKEGICECCDKKLLGEYVYPDFTAEKQLELIKLLLSGLCDFTGYHGLCDKYHLCFGHTRAEHQDFTQALAQLTTELMKAGELDKEKVREVLER